MEKLLTKYFWIFNIVALTLVAFFLAQGSGEIASSSIEKLLPKPEERQKKKTPRKNRRSRRTATIPPKGDTILSRNIFDSETGPIPRYPELEKTDMDDSETLVTPDGLPIVPCSDNSIKLVSTVASRENLAWSFATVLASGKTRMYRMGDELINRKVSGITWRYMFLRGTTDECYMDMFADPNQKTPTPRRPTSPMMPPPPGGGDNRIQKISDTESVIERSMVNELLSNPTQFIRSVRVRPHREGGKVVGYKLRRFRSNSPLAKLGAQKGDIIHAVNGVELNSVDKALGAYQSMRSANDLTFSITRGGKPMDLKVSIR
jgi:general secretion pathway protein C